MAAVLFAFASAEFQIPGSLLAATDRVEPAKPAKPKKSKCCPIGQSIGGYLVLDQVCLSDSETVFYLRLKERTRLCTIFEKVNLEDDRGRTYAPREQTGSTHCAKGMDWHEPAVWTWRFEPMPSNTRWFTLEEDADAAPESASGIWAWRHVSLENCKQ